jgi:transcriptional regulator with XRE-family HTH domain
MNKSFSNNILTLRKEIGLSQKQVADDLGISQALLSHYEKGIRECGLDFVVKAADYYGVTCDYLLGKSAVRTAYSSSDSATQNVKNPIESKNMLENLNKRVVVNGIDFVYRILGEINNKEVTKYSSEILMTSIYSVIRILYKINSNNAEEFFILNSSTQNNYINSLAEKNKAKLTEKIEELSKSRKFRDKPEISYEIITEKYGDIASSVLNLLHNTEKSIK